MEANWRPNSIYILTQTIVDGKYVELAKDRTKTKSSHRSLPLVPPFEVLLKELRKKQEEYMDLCGNSYYKDFLDYVYVNAIGQRIKPGYLTQAFPEFLEKHGMRRIRFHDLRHSCATLLYANPIWTTTPRWPRPTKSWDISPARNKIGLLIGLHGHANSCRTRLFEIRIS